MAWDIYLGPVGSEVLLPAPTWVDEPGDMPESIQKRYDSAAMLNGKIRYDFKGSSQRSWTIVWANLTRSQVDAMQTLADMRASLHFWNGMSVNPAWVTVALSKFEASAILDTFQPDVVERYEAAMTLDEEC